MITTKTRPNKFVVTFNSGWMPFWGFFNREGSPAIFLPTENVWNQYQDPWLSLSISRWMQKILLIQDVKKHLLETSQISVHQKAVLCLRFLAENISPNPKDASHNLPNPNILKPKIWSSTKSLWYPSAGRVDWTL